MSPHDLNAAEALIELKPLLFFVFGISVYAIFIFNFYRFVGRKDIFQLDLSRYEQSRLRALRMLLHVLTYIGKYLILFPVVAFAWFAILTVLLAFLAKGHTIDNLLLISMAILSAIRISAYYNEDLSRDLSKMLPFALLGVFLIDLSYFSLETSVNALLKAILSWDTVVYYLAFVIALEFILRVTTPVLKPIFSPPQKRRESALSGSRT